MPPDSPPDTSPDSSSLPRSTPGSGWTVLDVLKWTTSYFDSRQIDSPRLSAELLLAHVLNIARLELYLRFDQPLSAMELADYKAFIRRRADGEPAAYIVGEKSFWSMEFDVTPDVLIPRPDTECLVETALAILSEDGDHESSGHQDSDKMTGGRYVWEPATGSGAVILSLARHAPGHHFLASDISEAALHLARRNAGKHQLDGRINFFTADWFAALRPDGPKFDMIVVNPPYIEADTIETLSPEVYKFEPRLALDGGADGLVHVGHILKKAGTFLKPGGHLLMEIGWDQKDRVRQLADATGQYEDVQFVKDMAGHDRAVRLKKQA